MKSKYMELISIFQQLSSKLSEEQLTRLLTYAHSLQQETVESYLYFSPDEDMEFKQELEKEFGQSPKELQYMGIDKGNNSVELLEWKSMLDVKASGEDFNVFKMQLLFKNCANKSIQLSGRIDCFDNEGAIVKDGCLYSPNIKSGANWKCFQDLLVPKSVVSYEIVLEDQDEY